MNLLPAVESNQLRELASCSLAKLPATLFITF
jgi:hypothetical protein